MEYGWFSHARNNVDLKTSGIIDVLKGVGRGVRDVFQTKPGKGPHDALDFPQPVPITNSKDIVTRIRIGIAPYLRNFEVTLKSAKGTVSQLDDSPEKLPFMKQVASVIKKIEKNNTKLSATSNQLGPCDAVKKYREAQGILQTIKTDMEELQNLANQAKDAVGSDTDIYIYTARVESIFDLYMNNTTYEAFLNEYSAKHGCP